MNKTIDLTPNRLGNGYHSILGILLRDANLTPEQAKIVKKEITLCILAQGHDEDFANYVIQKIVNEKIYGIDNPMFISGGE